MTAQTILNHSFRIAKKDLTELFRNRLGLVLLIVMPLFMMVMVGFIYPSNGGAPSNLPIALVNEDAGFNNSTVPSQTFVTILQAINNQTGMMTLTNATSENTVSDMIQRGELDGGILIPSNFSQCLLSGQQGNVKIITDESNPQMSATIRGALTAVINEMGTMMAQQYMQITHQAINSTQALAMVQPFVVSASTQTTQAITASPLPIVLVNEDSGYNDSIVMSQTFITILQGINNQTRIMNLTSVPSESTANNMLKTGTSIGTIVIPSNFSQSIFTGQQGTIIILTNDSNPVMSATVRGTLTAIVNEMGTIMAQQNIQATHQALNSTQALAVVQPYVVPAPEQSNYFDFIAPGIMAMTVMMSVMTGLPVAISQEKEIGTMDGMMVAPVNRLSILLGKTAAQTARGLIQGLIILALAIGIFGVAIQGSILLVFALLLLGVFSFVGLGIVITSFTKDQETAQMLMMTLMFPMMFLSGVFFPIQQMPWYMQDISKFLPLTYASDALRKVMVLGAGVPQISTDLIILIVFGVVMIAIALPVFRRMMTR
jgi:ABC-2 type transport system permease protein